MNKPIESIYKTLLNRSPSQEEIEHLQRIKTILNISDNDALWTVIMCLESYHARLDRIPHHHTDELNRVLDEKKDIIQQQIGEHIQANITALSSHIVKLADKHQKARILHYRWLSMTVITLVGICGFLLGIIAS